MIATTVNSHRNQLPLTPALLSCDSLAVFANVVAKLANAVSLHDLATRPGRQANAMISAVSTPSNFSQTYVKFFNLVRAIRQKDQLFALDPVEERLLNSFAVVWGAGRLLSASEAAVIVEDVAPRTVQRRVVSLLNKGLLRVETDENDNRIKYFFATDRTSQYFEKLGQCLEQVKRR